MRETPNIGVAISQSCPGAGVAVNKPAQVLFASLIGTTIEFFDFYIFATAAVLVFPKLFFPTSDPASATLASLATFAIAFFARPVGSALFGHFGDRVGRKATLVAALLTMGLSTVAIGALPTYRTIGVAAPALLAFFRFGQGLGLGGEWGGAVLLAIENAPPGKRAWYGMFPQLGAPVGFLFPGDIPGALEVAHRRAVLRLRLAHSVSGERRAGARRPLRAADDYRDAGVPRRAQPARARESADADGVSRTHQNSVRGHACGARNIRALLPDDGLRAVLGHHRARLQPREVSGDAIVRHRVLRDFHSRRRGPGRTRASPHAPLGDCGDRRVRPGDGADVPRRQRPGRC